MSSPQRLLFRGVLLPADEPVDLYVVDGRVTFEPVAGAQLVASGGWIVPGLVDAHCHIGLGVDGAVGREEQERQATSDRDAGALTLRDCGSPSDTRWIDDRDDLPHLLRAGRHIGRPRRYLRDIGREVEPAQLVATVEEEVAHGDGWVKLVGDWIDRDRGDLAPLWPQAELTAAIARAHELGARVTAHCFGEEALPGLLDAGIDCIEHGTGVTPDLLQRMADARVALVPTLVNIARFPGIAERAGRYPVYAEHMRALHRTVHERIGAAHEAGVPVYTGTDAGSEIVHGRIADEVLALTQVGMSPRQALAAASWEARAWLGVAAGTAEGDDAAFVVYAEDPTADLRVVAAPQHVVLGRHVVHTRT